MSPTRLLILVGVKLVVMIAAVVGFLIYTGLL